MTEFNPNFRETIIEAPIDSVCHRSVINRDKLEKTLEKGIMGDCRVASMVLYLKLEKIGVKRMRGKRTIEMSSNWGGYHYWVENKDYVFEENCGVRQIVKKDDYYKMVGMVEAEESTFDMFFENEIDTKDKNYRKFRRQLAEKLPLALSYRRHIVEECEKAEAKRYE